MKIRNILFSVVFLFGITPVFGGISTLSGVALAQAASKPLTFGIVPQQSAAVLAQAWVPILKSLGELTNLEIEFKTTKDIPTFEACLSKGAYDLAYMNPYHYIVFHDAPGYAAFARERDFYLQGLIVVRSASGITTLKELQGATIAFPAPASFAASVIPRAALKSEGISFTPSYVKSHDSVYLAVDANLFVAGGGVERTFENMPQEIREKLTVIYRTKNYTPHAFAAHRDLSSTIVNMMEKAMVQLDRTAPNLLAPIGVSGFQRATDPEWDDIRALKLTREDTGVSSDGGASCPSD